jgi:hypothetical protein
MEIVETKENAKREAFRCKDYTNNLKHYLMTSRFTNATWRENVIYREKYKNIGCIYCAPQQVSKSIAIDKIMFILEMNNETNKIMGIGMVRNHYYCNKYNVYEEGNYNRYVYVGKNRIDRTEMNDEEEIIMKIFDILCFYGTTHSKRGQGLKCFPIPMLYRCSKKMDLVDKVAEIFKRRENAIKKLNDKKNIEKNPRIM